jgi:hypothetical protein
MTLFTIPKCVFVPLQWTGKYWDGEKWKDRWVKRDDLPRFREPEEAAQYIINNPRTFFHEGKPAFIQWQERDERALIDEFMRGVGTPEWLSLGQTRTKGGCSR